ncbi:MAG TPA: hypothetical protein VHG31_06605 [Stellaceae bacterium]|jgi:hypothetical protein|nr:hypothetical protein [Stellaceae bacterium]
MGMLEFQVCKHDGEARWIVRLGSSVYGFYLDREQALLDAVDAARDASESGREAQVWLYDSAETARIF